MYVRTIRNARRGIGWVTSMAALCSLSHPTNAMGCPVSEPEATREISIALGSGRSAIVTTNIFARSDEASFCQASVEVPLSAFPTSRLVLRPADVARSLHDVVAQLDVEECMILVMIENDTREELADHELCLVQSFRFGERRFWSGTREDYCWEPDEIDAVEEEILASAP